MFSSLHVATYLQKRFENKTPAVYKSKQKYCSQPHTTTSEVYTSFEKIFHFSPCDSNSAAFKTLVSEVHLCTILRVIRVC